jgi:hypothetical protein
MTVMEIDSCTVQVKPRGVGLMLYITDKDASKDTEPVLRYLTGSRMDEIKELADKGKSLKLKVYFPDGRLYRTIRFSRTDLQALKYIRLRADMIGS